MEHPPRFIIHPRSPPPRILTSKSMRKFRDDDTDDEDHYSCRIYHHQSESPVRFRLRKETIATCLVSLGAIIVAIVTAHHVTNAFLEAVYYSDEWSVATTPHYEANRNLQPSQLRSSHIVAGKLDTYPTPEAHRKRHSVRGAPSNFIQQSKILRSNTVRNMTDEPHVAWLMSFPNSGTSFTLHLMQAVSNYTTATNYALEGEIKDQPSVPAIAGEKGEQGPWLEILPGRPVAIPKFILTKTHCKGFCHNCPVGKTIQTIRSFLTGCLQGKRAVTVPGGNLDKVVRTYSTDLVKKAIHLYRHPLDNVVARFNLEHQVQEDFPYSKTSEGFRQWCLDDDVNSRDLIRSPWMDIVLKKMMKTVPCYAEFFRYVQWHNLANVVTNSELRIPVLTVHYDEYAQDLNAARNKLLNFLELPLVGENVPFHAGKVYLDYYTPQERGHIRAFLKEYASDETWKQLERYDFAESVDFISEG